MDHPTSRHPTYRRPTFLGSASAVPTILLLVAVATRFWDFGNPVVHVDEQFYLLVGDRMLHGALPYVDIWDRKPVGLFLIFAAIRLLPGDGILAYQLVATGFAIATACLVQRGARRLGAAPTAALVAGICYLLWLPLLSGRGGQSPVFYNLFVTAAAILTLRLPTLAQRGAASLIVANGGAACLLAGLAIQTKYTPVVEGAFFGLAHLWYLHRAGARLPLLAGAAMLWIALGIAPTAAIVIDYARRGPEVFQVFWFSNFASVGLRRGYPAAKIVGRLAGTTAQLSPFIVATILAWRTRPWTPERTLAFGWLAAALVAFAMIGAFFDHYALPLVAPLAMIAAPILGRSRRAMLATLGIGCAIFTGKLLLRSDFTASTRAVARIMRAESGSGCPYVFAGDAILYHLSGTCLPTRYAFPSTLAYDSERGASGADEVAEVTRILAARPPVIVTLDHPLAPWNEQSHALVAQALARDYVLVFSAPRESERELVYKRR